MLDKEHMFALYWHRKGTYVLGGIGMKRKVTILSTWRFAVFLSVILLLALTAFWLLFNYTDAKSQVQYTTIQVSQGDTLWAIAGNWAPDGMDVREYIHKIKHANGMERSDICAGDQLLLPVYE
jgi:hypothetical protein